MRTDDRIIIHASGGKSFPAELRVYRIPSTYHRDDPGWDLLGVGITCDGHERAAQVNMRHPSWHGTYDAILRFVELFATENLGIEYDHLEVAA